MFIVLVDCIHSFQFFAHLYLDSQYLQSAHVVVTCSAEQQGILIVAQSISCNLLDPVCNKLYLVEIVENSVRNKIKPRSVVIQKLYHIPRSLDRLTTVGLLVLPAPSAASNTHRSYQDPRQPP